MRTIYKYPIQITDHQVIPYSPKMSPKLLHVGLDPSGVPCIWAEVDTIDIIATQDLAELEVYIVGTGNPIPDHIQAGVGQYFASFVQGPFVWHVYIHWGKCAQP